MDLEDLFPSKPDDPLVALGRQDLDPMSIDELKERIETRFNRLKKFLGPGR